MGSERAYYNKIASTFQDSVLLLMAGLILSFSYIQQVQDALKNVGGRINYHIGFIATQIYETNGKHVFFNWGFLFFVVLGIVLLYFSVLSKEEAEEAKKRVSSTGVSKDDFDPLESNSADS